MAEQKLFWLECIQLMFFNQAESIVLVCFRKKKYIFLKEIECGVFFSVFEHFCHNLGIKICFGFNR